MLESTYLQRLEGLYYCQLHHKWHIRVVQPLAAFQTGVFERGLIPGLFELLGTTYRPMLQVCAGGSV